MYADYEYHKFYMRRYHKIHKEEFKKWNQRDYIKNKSRYITRSTIWRKEHQERHTQLKRNSRLRQKIFNMERLK